MSRTFCSCCAVVFLMSLVSTVGSSQVGGSTAVNAETLRRDLLNLDRGTYSFPEIEEVVSEHDLQALPHLEAAFKAAKNEELKMKLASGLIRLKDGDPTYMNYLLERGQAAATRDSPSPLNTAANEVGDPNAFRRWAAQRGLSEEQAAQQARGDMFAMMFLAETVDSRGDTVLRKAMESNNPVILQFAAQGLARNHDDGSVPLMLAAAKRVPAASIGIAIALVYFDDPAAQKAVDGYLSSGMADELRHRRAAGKDAFGR